MKNKLVFHADKMKIQSLLCGLSAVLSVLLLVYSIANSNGDNGNAEYGQLIVYSILTFAPVALCIFILEYGKKGAESRRLIIIYAFGSVILTLISIVYNYVLIGISNIDVSSVINTVISLIFCVLSAVFCEQRRLFRMVGVGVVLKSIYDIFNSVLVLIVTFTEFDALNNFDVMKVIVYSSVCGLIQNCLSLACVIIWFFFVFSEYKNDIEKKLENLIKDYTSGKISKEDYDSERQKIINSI